MDEKKQLKTNSYIWIVSSAALNIVIQLFISRKKKYTQNTATPCTYVAARKRVISLFGVNIFLSNVCNVNHSVTRLENFFVYICRFVVVYHQLLKLWEYCQYIWNCSFVVIVVALGVELTRCTVTKGKAVAPILVDLYSFVVVVVA